MPIDTTPSTVATSALQAIPFSSLIGGPLDAAIKAQALAAKTSWEFIQQVGLNTDPTTGQKSAVNVTFFYNKGGKISKLIVPLLTIVPIPYIAIDDIQINFKANISASSSTVASNSESTAMDAGGSAKASFGYGPFSVSAEFKANYSSKKDSKSSSESKYSVEYTMDLAVHAGQSDMPAGLSAVLNILQSSITDVGAHGSILLSPANPQVDVAGLALASKVKPEIGVTLKDGDGVLMANKKVIITCGTQTKDGTTDKDGNVIIALEFDVAADMQPAKFEVAVDGDTKLKDSGKVTFIGKPA